MIVVQWVTDHVEVTQDSLSPSPVLAFTASEWQEVIDAQANGQFEDPTLPLQFTYSTGGFDMYRLADAADYPTDTSKWFFVPRRPDMAVFIVNMQEGDYNLDVLQGGTPA